MKDSFFLVFDHHGVVKINKQQRPHLISGQRLSVVDIEVDDAIFEPTPTPRVAIRIGKTQVQSPPLEAAVVELGEFPVEEYDPQDQSFIRISRAAGRLLQAGLRSSDPDIQREALEVLQNLEDANIEVRIETPGNEAQA